MAQMRERLGADHGFFKSNPTPEKLIDHVCIKLKRRWQIDVGEDHMLVMVYEMDRFLGSISYMSLADKPVSLLVVDAIGKDLLTKTVREFLEKELWK